MKFAHFFVERPIFAAVLAILTILVGSIAYVNLPIAQYPEIVPPTIVVRATYPGANAETVAQTVATVLEQEINGVEDMLYMSSQSVDGGTSVTITFKLGVDLNVAQVLVQNRVAVAEPRLPEEVRRLGVVTRKSSPDLMMVVHLLSPDNSLDQLYVSNYALLKVRDQLLRLSGVGDITVFGAREYSLRVWLDPERLSAFGLTAADAVKALQEQNVQVSGGSLGQPPANAGNSFQFTVSTQGRFDNPEQFKDVVVKAGTDNQLVRLRDVARIELGAKDYGTNSYLDKQAAVGMGIFQRPGTNAVAGAKEIIATMEGLKKDFPKGLEYRIVYNPTEFISDSITEVYKTLGEALIIVALVVLLFLQSWRTAIIPLIAVPVSLIGTFAIMLAFGFSINLLTLFGLILAIGIVVDDAIVVVENVERHIRDGKTPREAAHITMDEVGGAIIAIALVLAAVFIPTAFVPGISGQFYKQFALTISVATIISAFNSLTLSPALAAILLKPHDAEEHTNNRSLIGRAAASFNRGFDWLSERYGSIVKFIIGYIAPVMIVYGILLLCTGGMAKIVPTGFIPAQDQGYAITVVQLPDGASLARTDEVVKQVVDILDGTPGVKNAVAFAGFSGATFTNSSNAGAIFARFDDFDSRVKNKQSIQSIMGDITKRLGGIQDAFTIVVQPPPVRGLGNGGGFKLQIKDMNGAGFVPTLDAAMGIMGQAAQNKQVAGVFTTFTANTPQVFLDIDRDKAQILNVPIGNIFNTLQINLGSAYVNDFNIFGRVYQVTAQADLPFRLQPEDIGKLKTVSSTGELVPLGSLVTVRNITGPSLVQRYNMATSIPLTGSAAPGVSTGEALNVMEKIAQEALPAGMSYEWTELAFQEKQAGNAAVYILGLSVLFVFLLLAALYESWTLPLAIILIVPMSILCAFIGVWLRGLDNNILTQVGFVVLIGLAAKNAILIVEFAVDKEKQEGMNPYEAVLEAARLRLRPILMTSLAFILGVVPLLLATGPGAEMRQALGTAVFSGMFGVTFFGLILTPVFYIAMRKLGGMKPLQDEQNKPAFQPTVVKTHVDYPIA